jgi:hypothetical protein
VELKSELRDLLEELALAVEPLLHGFMTLIDDGIVRKQFYPAAHH